MDNGLFLTSIIPLLPIWKWKVRILTEVSPHVGIVLYHQKLAPQLMENGWLLDDSGASSTTMEGHGIHPPTHLWIISI